MPPAAPPPPQRSTLFWLAVAAAGMCGLCGLGTVGLLALGALAGDSDPPGLEQGAGQGGGRWLPAGERARSATLAQPLAGGRWVYQNGSGMETVLARSGDTALVRENRSGAIYELSFSTDGTYLLRWRHASDFMTANTSSADERGTWALAGTALTLTPESQKARYTNSGLAQDKEDVDLAPRTYRVVDIELETITQAGVEYRTFPGVELEGPAAAWDVTSNPLSLDLQRLE